VFLRSHVLSAHASVRDSLPRLCDKIPSGVLDEYRFAHSKSGFWAYFAYHNTREPSLYHNMTRLQFPSDKMIFPSQFMKPDLVGGLVAVQAKCDDIPFSCSVRARAGPMSSTDFFDAIKQLNPIYFYEGAHTNRELFVKWWRNNPQYFEKYVRCVFSASGFHPSVSAFVEKYNTTFGAVQPILLMAPHADLCGTSVTQMFSTQLNLKDVSPRNIAINEDINTLSIAQNPSRCLKWIDEQIRSEIAARQKAGKMRAAPETGIVEMLSPTISPHKKKAKIVGVALSDVE